MEPARGTLQSLPPDAQRLVMQARPELLSSWSSTSARNQQLLSSHFAILCRDKPISFDEFTKFLDQVLATPGRTFGIVDVKSGANKSNNGLQYLIDITEYGVITSNDLRFRHLPVARFNTLRPNIAADAGEEGVIQIKTAASMLNVPVADVLMAYTGYQHLPNHSLKISTDYILSIKMQILSQKSTGAMFSDFVWYELDFRSQYFIYQNRISCMKANPEYARQKIISALNFLIAQSDNGNFPEVLIVAARLIAEAKIVGIPYIQIRDIRGPITLTGIEAARSDESLYWETQEVNHRNGNDLIEYYAKANIVPRIMPITEIETMGSRHETIRFLNSSESPRFGLAGAMSETL